MSYLLVLSGVRVCAINFSGRIYLRCSFQLNVSINCTMTDCIVYDSCIVYVACLHCAINFWVFFSRSECVCAIFAGSRTPPSIDGNAPRNLGLNCAIYFKKSVMIQIAVTPCPFLWSFCVMADLILSALSAAVMYHQDLWILLTCLKPLSLMWWAQGFHWIGVCRVSLGSVVWPFGLYEFCDFCGLPKMCWVGSGWIARNGACSSKWIVSSILKKVCWWDKIFELVEEFDLKQEN